jgi:hypothetical protein
MLCEFYRHFIPVDRLSYRPDPAPLESHEPLNYTSPEVAASELRSLSQCR